MSACRAEARRRGAVSLTSSCVCSSCPRGLIGAGRRRRGRRRGGRSCGRWGCQSAARAGDCAPLDPGAARFAWPRCAGQQKRRGGQLGGGLQIAGASASVALGARARHVARDPVTWAATTLVTSGLTARSAMPDWRSQGGARQGPSDRRGAGAVQGASLRGFAFAGAHGQLFEHCDACFGKRAGIWSTQCVGAITWPVDPSRGPLLLLSLTCFREAITFSQEDEGWAAADQPQAVEQCSDEGVAVFDQPLMRRERLFLWPDTADVGPRWSGRRRRTEAAGSSR